MPQRFGTVGCQAVATGQVSLGGCAWKTLAGWGRDGTGSPKSSSLAGATQGCLPESGAPGLPPFSRGKPSSFEMKPANKCIPESMFIRSDFSLL